MDSSCQSRMNGLVYSHSLINFSFIAIIFINTLFFSGYYVLKDPLAFILNTEGIPLKQAYSITTSANTLLALSSLFFGFTLHHCGKQKFSLFIGMLLSVVAIYLLSIKNMRLSMLAITLYVIGGGLYFFNIVIFINRLFSNAQSRIKGNYIYQIFVNFGAVIGCILFLVQLKTENAFKYCLMSGSFSLLIFILLYNYIDDPTDNKTDHKKFFFYLLLLFGIVFIALNFAETTRLMVLISFIVAVINMIHKARAEANRALLSFISLVFAFSIPYWIANTIIFNQFFYFLTKNVTSIHGLSPATLIMIDPIVNTLFGSSLFLWQKNRIVQHNKNLSYSSMLIGVSFIILSLGLFLNYNETKISFLYPLAALCFFACAEFLLQTTLNSRIRDLLSTQKNSEFLATGMMRSSRAFATVLGYYLMLLSTQTINVNNTLANLHLYLVIVLIFILSYFGFYLLRKIKVIQII